MLFVYKDLISNIHASPIYGTLTPKETTKAIHREVENVVNCFNPNKGEPIIKTMRQALKTQIGDIRRGVLHGILPNLSKRTTVSGYAYTMQRFGTHMLFNGERLSNNTDLINMLHACQIHADTVKNHVIQLEKLGTVPAIIIPFNHMLIETIERGSNMATIIATVHGVPNVDMIMMTINLKWALEDPNVKPVGQITPTYVPLYYHTDTKEFETVLDAVTLSTFTMPREK